jgi:hypothetical protein
LGQIPIEKWPLLAILGPVFSKQLQLIAAAAPEHTISEKRPQKSQIRLILRAKNRLKY